jgi:hypothetical protein
VICCEEGLHCHLFRHIGTDGGSDSRSSAGFENRVDGFGLHRFADGKARYGCGSSFGQHNLLHLFPSRQS